MRNPSYTRQCVICKNRQLKNELIRLVRIDGIVYIDKTNKMFGRGVYICNSCECIDKADAKNLLNRAFKAQISMDNKEIIFKELREFGRK